MLTKAPAPHTIDIRKGSGTRFGLDEGSTNTTTLPSGARPAVPSGYYVQDSSIQGPAGVTMERYYKASGEATDSFGYSENGNWRIPPKNSNYKDPSYDLNTLTVYDFTNPKPSNGVYKVDPINAMGSQPVNQAQYYFDPSSGFKTLQPIQYQTANTQPQFMYGVSNGIYTGGTSSNFDFYNANPIGNTQSAQKIVSGYPIESGNFGTILNQGYGAMGALPATGSGTTSYPNSSAQWIYSQEQGVYIQTMSSRGGASSIR